ncbi:hypothetical protein FB45DRAFT_249567 [Roridomyces roridus]|uniref:Uncharacterized protein n=1 Tax=Roridomyces roridus TaxID=1738132 RepID=A0AAD7FF50_9AGAR|nr:hypothetical protein FB45DRAFT_249567 [Roridomyces roridus]
MRVYDGYAWATTTWTARRKQQGNAEAAPNARANLPDVRLYLMSASTRPQLPASGVEPNYIGTWGDYASFVHHMSELAVDKNVDLLLADSGDLHDG